LELEFEIQCLVAALPLMFLVELEALAASLSFFLNHPNIAGDSPPARVPGLTPRFAPEYERSELFA
jgi:hypothetical protein